MEAKVNENVQYIINITEIKIEKKLLICPNITLSVEI